MRPLTVVNLIILGSSFAITFSLAAVLIVVLILGDEYPRLEHEFEPLLDSFTVFLGMTAISAASFWGLIHNRHWKYWAHAGMWFALFATGWYYWP